MTQETFFEWNGIRCVPELLRRYKVRRLFFVVDKSAYASCGAEKKLSTLEKAHEVVRFSEFAKNPKKEDVEKGRELYRKTPFDAILAIGGGSAIDMAKLIRAAGHRHTVDDLIDKRATYDEKFPLFIAAPTTAGTGSEATHFAVIYRDKSKYSVAHPTLLPDVAIVDPSLTASMPSRLTAITGFDAFSHAIESYWAVGATYESQKYAKDALARIMKGFETAIHNPTQQAREDMAYGAHYAGKAIDISKTTAPHAFSYIFTSYFGIPHGHAVAMTLGRMIEYNMRVLASDVMDPRGANYVRNTIQEIFEMLGCQNAKEARDKVEALMERAGLATRLSQIGITKSEIKFCAQSVNSERLGNNPRVMREPAITKLLMGIL